MRLNRSQIDTINELARKHFRLAATVYFFGFRGLTLLNKHYLFLIKIEKQV